MKQNKNSIAYHMNREYDILKYDNGLLEGALLGISLLMFIFTLFTSLNLIFPLAFMFVAFATICLISAKDYDEYKDFEKNRRETLKELYAEDMKETKEE